MKIKNILKTVFVFLFVMTCFSCHNFMNGSNIADDLTNVVDYMKSPYVEVEIAVDNKNCYQSMSPSPNKYSGVYKKSDKIELSITTTGGFTFLEWQVEPESARNAVKFDDAKSSDTKVTILQSVEKIIIKPYCLLFPNINSVVPDTSFQEQYIDSVMEITFNQKVDPEYFVDEDIKFKNISITSNYNTGSLAVVNKTVNINMSERINDYFFKPEVLLNDNKLYIKPNVENLEKLLNTNNEYLIIDVVIDLKNLFKDMVHGNEDILNRFFLNNDGSYSFSYRIVNIKQDTEPPVFIENGEFRAARTKEDVLSENAENHLDFTKERWEQDKLSVTSNEKIWLYAKFKDDRQNIQKIIIGEQYLGNSFSDNNSALILEKVYYPDDNLITVNKKNENNIFYEFLAEYPIAINSNGYLRLYFTAYDASNIPLQKNVDVINLKDIPEPKIYRNNAGLVEKTEKEEIEITAVFDTAKEWADKIDSTINYTLGALSTEYNKDTNPFYCKIDEISVSKDGISYVPVSNIKQTYFKKNNLYCPAATVKFTRDCTDDCYLKIEYSNSFGLSNQIIKKIQRNISVVEAELAQNSSNLMTVFLSKKPFDKYFIYYKAPGAENYIKITDNAFLSECNSNVNSIDLDKAGITEDGIYELYVLPREEITENTYSFIDEAGNSQTLSPLSGSLGNSFCITKERASSKTNIPTEAKPNYLEMSAEQIVSEKGNCSIQIKYPQGFNKHQDYTYKYIVSNITDGTEDYSFEDIIQVKLGKKYLVTLHIIDSLGNYQDIWTSNVVDFSSVRDKSVIWDDELQWNFYDEPNHISVTTLSENEEKFVYKNSISFSEMNYYYYFASEDNIPYSEVKKYPGYKEIKRVGFPFDINFYGEAGEYIYICLDDGNGCEAMRTLHIQRKDNFRSDEFHFKPMGSYFIIYTPETNCTLQVYDITKKEWLPIENKSSNSKYVAINPAEYGNNFIKICSDYYYKDTSKNEGIIQTNSRCIIHPSIYLEILNDNRQPDNTVNVFAGDMGNTVLLDSTQAFVHTLWSPKNFGKDIQKWETYGKEVNTFYSDKTFTYNYSLVNAAEGYYITVVYIADKPDYFWCSNVDVVNKLN